MFRHVHKMPNVADVIENALALPRVDRSYVASKPMESFETEGVVTGDAIAEYDQRVEGRQESILKQPGA